MSLRRICTCHGDARRAGERGVALVTTLLLTGLVTALGVAVAMLTTVETWLSAGFRTSQELSYAADAAIGRTHVDLASTADWSDVLRPAAPVASPFNDGLAAVAMIDGTVVDLAAETRALQDETDGRCGSRAAVPDCPEWRLFAHAPLKDLIPGGTVSSPLYVAAWVADDPFDNDRDPAVDANRRLLVRAKAFGPQGARRSAEAVFARVAPGVIHMAAWRNLR